MRRRKPLRRKGGRRFPKRHDPAYWAWLMERLAMRPPCDACGIRFAQCRAHIIPRSRGGYDRGNVVLLCGSCDRLSEKRMDAFMTETGRDLYARAAEWDRRFQEDRWHQRG